MNGAFQKLLQRLEADDDDDLSFVTPVRDPVTSIRGRVLLNTTLPEVCQRDQERARAAIEREISRLSNRAEKEKWRLPSGMVCSARLP